MQPVTYLAVCRDARGGDVISRTPVRVTQEFDTLDAARNWAAQWYRAGPNGPVRTAEVYVLSSAGTLSPAEDMGPHEAVSVSAYRLSDGFYRASVTLRGKKIAAGNGVYVDEADALSAASAWASNRSLVLA